MSVADKTLRDLVGEEWAEVYSKLCELDEKQPWLSLWQTLADFRRGIESYQQAKRSEQEAE